ncbi:iron ABC transporter permease [Ornithinibacillus gellani]|uniref:FecCD family ABC transporter permease n=1 Tax=Ornithinibacillus gellani TaxID=2293253 RepID=UPI000F47CD9E|nr:iron ABC transporter permease [Ornithinibacillus gellani]
MFIIAILFGAANTSITDVWLAITTNRTQEPISVIRDFRLPRELAAVFVGAALAVAGAIMQGMTRNPLADPGLLGLTAGANAILAITMAFFPDIHYFGIMIACFIGAAIGAGMVYGIGALGGGKLSSFRIVLAGAAVSALLYAVEQGVGIYFKVSKDISMWTAGGFIGTTWTQLYVIVPFIVFGILLAIGLAKQLTILSLNEEVAIGLGQNTAMIKTILFLVVIILAGTAVALVGNIAFVGLMIPHIVRAIIGTDYRSVIPMSAIVGAIFMLFADTIARTLNAPFETPIIAVAAILGLPFFLMIVRKGSASL